MTVNISDKKEYIFYAGVMPQMYRNVIQRRCDESAALVFTDREQSAALRS